MEDMIIAMALSILFAAIKNPANKAKLKKSLLKLRDQINLLYPEE